MQRSSDVIPDGGNVDISVDHANAYGVFNQRTTSLASVPWCSSTNAGAKEVIVFRNSDFLVQKKKGYFT